MLFVRVVSTDNDIICYPVIIYASIFKNNYDDENILSEEYVLLEHLHSHKFMLYTHPIVGNT